MPSASARILQMFSRPHFALSLRGESDVMLALDLLLGLAWQRLLVGLLLG